jgi:hypothetical protein
MLPVFFYFLVYDTEKKKATEKETKKPLSKYAKGLVIVWLPLLDTFRTFKGNIATENIRLNQLVFQ